MFTCFLLKNSLCFSKIEEIYQGENAMKTKTKETAAYILWACLYILCVGLGTVENVRGFAKVLFVLTALIFFLPGVYVLILGIREKNRQMILRVRIVAICSLVLTVSVFCANLLGVMASDQAGAFLHDLLNLVSAPMFCSQYWVLSIFCWACLLSASFTKKKGEV
jgi:hypothetical protein